MKIPLDKIIFDPFQARISMSEEELNDLASSIKTIGQRDSIHVYAYQDKYVVYDGERRVRAMRLGGFNDVDAVQDGTLTSLEPSDAAVLKMRERAYQANDQRADLTSMERGRALLKMLRDGKDLYVNPTNHQLSSKALADAIHRSPQTVQRLIANAKAEEKLYGSESPAGLPTENAAIYRYTSALADFPEERKALIELVSGGDMGLLRGDGDLHIVSQALAALPEAKDQIFEMISKKIAPDVIKSTAIEAASLPEDVRARYVQLTLNEKISREELPVLADVLRSNEELADYAMSLRETRTSEIKDVQRSVLAVSKMDETRKEFFIQAKTMFIEDPNAYLVSLPNQEPLPIELVELTRNPNFAQIKDLRLNLEAHLALILASEKAKCPYCGEGRLVWDCCHKGLEDSKNRAKENFEKRN